VRRPINGCYHPHAPSPFVVITQPQKLILILPSHGGWKAESTLKHGRKRKGKGKGEKKKGRRGWDEKGGEEVVNSRYKMTGK